MCVVTQYRIEREQSLEEIEKEYMYLIGGFAGWPRDDPRWNGDRTRNDVWLTTDGRNWSRVAPPPGKRTMPFIGRVWHSCTVWHDHKSRNQSVRLRSASNQSDASEGAFNSFDNTPKIYISGGGYIGTKGNNAVTKLEGYVDLWWSRDGSNWTRVDYEEGEKQSLYSTNEWTSTLVQNKYVHLGKWGHSMVSFELEEDIDLDGDISYTSKVIEYCAGSRLEVTQCEQMYVEEDKVPSLFIIGGDTTDGGPIVNDVFVSRTGGK